MPPYPWILTEPGRHDPDTEEEAIKPIRGIRDVSPRLEKEEGHSPTDPPIELPHQEGHASNVDKWATSPETVQGRRRRKASTLLIIMTTTSRSIFHPPPYQEITWLQ